MAYNNFYPQYYVPQYQLQTNSSIVWVASEQEAQNYPIAPNNAIVLWDSSKPSIYLKQADASGRPTFKAYNLVEQKPVSSKSVSNNDEIAVLIDEIKTLKDTLKEITNNAESILSHSRKSNKQQSDD